MSTQYFPARRMPTEPPPKKTVRPGCFREKGESRLLRERKAAMAREGNFVRRKTELPTRSDAAAGRTAT